MKIDLFNFSYAIFDADGTIFDSMELYEETFAFLLGKFYISEEKAKKFYKDSAGSPLPWQFAQILNKRSGYDIKFTPEHQEIKQLVGEFMQTVSSIISLPFPGVKDILRSLYGNYRLNLFLTSGTTTEILEKRLAAVRINLFKEVMGSEVIPKGLGHIEVFARVTRNKRKEFCQKAFFVGDGPADMQLAREAGIYAIGLTTTVSEEMLRQAGAQEIIHSLSQLIS